MSGAGAERRILGGWSGGRRVDTGGARHPTRTGSLASSDSRWEPGAGFLARQLVAAALTANAVRPVPGYAAGVPAFAAGWAVSELAPHLLAVTVADAARELRSGGTTRPRSRLALGLAAATAGGLTHLVGEARRAAPAAQRAVDEVVAAAPSAARAADPGHEVGDPGWRALINPLRARPDGVRVVRDVAYADQGRRGLVDLYLPPGDPPVAAPMLLQVHGGGWTIGDKRRQGLPLMHHLAAQGWVCVALNYRLAPWHRFPAQVVDVKRVLAWMRRHGAAYGGDPSYVAITGGSAGGHLAALAALTAGDPRWQPGFEDADTSVAAAVPHYAIFDVAGATGDPRAVALRDRWLGPLVLGTSWRRDPEAFTRASPLHHVHAAAPAFLVLHGTGDSVVPVRQARHFVRRLREVSREPVGYAELPGAQHSFDVLPSLRATQVVRSVGRFLRWHHASQQAGGYEAAARDTAAG